MDRPRFLLGVLAASAAAAAPARAAAPVATRDDLVTGGDIVTYDLDSNALDAGGVVSYTERFIHGPIYKTRPDVLSVVHAHTPAVIPFSVANLEHRGGSATNVQVNNAVLGDALARTLGAANVALMRGHGMVAVAGSIPEAVFRAYYTVQDAQIEAEALRLGSVKFLTADEAKQATQTQAGLAARAWDLWKLAAVR